VNLTSRKIYHSFAVKNAISVLCYHSGPEKDHEAQSVLICQLESCRWCNYSYTCPVKLCLHDNFKSNRGLRKHINNKHQWYYYFDEQPEVKREEIEINQPVKMKASTAHKPAFSLEEGIGLDFLKWLCTSCGGGKTEKEAKQGAWR